MPPKKTSVKNVENKAASAAVNAAAKAAAAAAKAAAAARAAAAAASSKKKSSMFGRTAAALSTVASTLGKVTSAATSVVGSLGHEVVGTGRLTKSTAAVIGQLGLGIVKPLVTSHNTRLRAAQNAQKKKNENAIAARLLNNASNNQGILCEMYWFNGWTTYSTGSNRGRVQTENHGNIRLKFRSAPKGTSHRVFEIYLNKSRKTDIDPLIYTKDPWIQKQYEEIKRSVLNKVQVVIAGHSHGGMLTTLFAQMLNNDPDVPQEKLTNLHVVTFNAIRLIRRNQVPRISHFYQIANIDDVAQFRRTAPRQNNSIVVSNKNFMLGRVRLGNNLKYRSNLNFRFNNKATHAKFDPRLNVLWLWKQPDPEYVTASRIAATLEAPFRQIASHKDYDLDKFVDAVLKMFNKTLQSRVV
jgi:hypothetical protein